jgi:hypothetical protein
MSRDSDRPSRSDADEHEELARALSAAWSPGDIGSDLNERLLAQAFGAHDEAERRESETLREALDGRGDHALAELASALGAAARPAALDPRHNDRLVSAALSAAKRPRKNVVFVVFGAIGAAAALAASVLLMLRAAVPERSREPAAYAVSRSTAPLFHEPFQTAGTSDRVERIAWTRARELRENRFAAWGVR